MALLFCDSFEHYATAQITQKWTNTINTAGGTLTIQSGTYRNGANAMQVTGYNGNQYVGIAKSLGGNYSTLFVGDAFYYTGALGQGNFLQFGDAGNQQVSVGFNIANAMVVYSGSTLLATSTASVSLNVWNYIEVEAVFSTTTTGSVTVRVNGVTLIAVTGVKTAQTSNAYANQVAVGNYFGGAQNNYVAAGYHDDFYICDNSGTTHNTFLGDIKVACLLPNANGRINQWTINGGTTNYGCVDTSPVATTNYVSDATVGSIDDYALSAYPGGTPLAVQVVAYAEKSDAGTRTLGLGVGNGTTEAFDAGHPLTQNSYQFFLSPLDANPLTSAAWASGDFSTLQAAIKEIA